MAVFAGDWPNWLPMVGHTLAKTHVYKSKYTSLRTYWLTDLSCVCPWSSAWSLTLLSLDLDQLYARRSYLAAPTLLGNDATVNMGRSLAFLFSFSLTGLIPSFAAGGDKFSAATMSHIQISNTLVGYCWHVVKPFIAVLVLYSSGAVVLWGVPYIGWAQMCMGLAMAGACAKRGHAIGPRQWFYHCHIFISNCKYRNPLIPTYKKCHIRYHFWHLKLYTLHWYNLYD